MMTLNQTRALLHKKFGVVKPTGRKNQVSVNCPFCVKKGLSPNTTYKLSINLALCIFHCFRCNTNGFLADIIPLFTGIQPEDVVSEQRELESLPSGTPLHKLTYPWDVLVFKIFHERGFSPSNMEKVCYFCEDYIQKGFSYGPRIIFPIYQRGVYRGFQARTVYKNTNPKYTGAAGMEKKTILYNYDIAFSQKEMIILTEGFFDCLKIGTKAVATLGKIISDEQIRMIKLGDFNKVVVFLDKDAEKEGRQNVKKLKQYFKTYLAIPPRKDPAEMSRQEIDDMLCSKLKRVY